jgi:hypothetical protein
MHIHKLTACQHLQPAKDITDFFVVDVIVIVIRQLAYCEVFVQPPSGHSRTLFDVPSMNRALQSCWHLHFKEGTRLLSLTKTVATDTHTSQPEAAGLVEFNPVQTSLAARASDGSTHKSTCLFHESDTNHSSEPVPAFRPSLKQNLLIHEHVKADEASEHLAPSQPAICEISIAEQRLAARLRAQIALVSFPLVDDCKDGE